MPKVVQVGIVILHTLNNLAINAVLSLMVDITLILEQLGFLSIDIDFCLATVWEISQLFVYNLIDDGRG